MEGENFRVECAFCLMHFDEIENHVCPNCGCADVRTLHRIDEDSYFDDDGGDVVTYVDSLAAHLGIDLGRAIVDKFNEVSERIGSNVVMEHNDEWYLRKESELTE